MPTKRYHKKSRAGCDTCKRRRVKCDEATPICGSCALRQDSCSYSQIATTRAKKAVARTTSSTTSPLTTVDFTPTYSLLDSYSGPTSRINAYNATRMKEMQLMHQWSTVTYLTSGPRNMEVFRDYTVNKALEYTYLMDILLAFTSLHSASKAVGAVNAHEHVTAALHYQNQSIAALNQGQALVRISKETCDPVLLVTGLNAVCTLMASLVPATSGEQLESIPEVLLRVRGCMLGLSEMVEQHRTWATDGELAQIFQSPTVQMIEEGGAMTTEKVSALSDAVLKDMDLDDAATPFYRSALEKLEKSYADNNGRSVVSWMVMVEPEFFQRAEMGEAAALVILACWGALTVALEDVWWTKYAGRRIVEDLYSRLSGCEDRWRELLLWCYEQVGLTSIHV